MSENSDRQDLSIHLDDSAQKVVASHSPNGPLVPITAQEFRQEIDAAGFGEYHINQASVDIATAKFNAGEPFDITIGEAVDGKFSVHTDSHQMAVYLNYTLPRGGQPTQIQSIRNEAAQKGVTVALDSAAIEQALREGGINILIAQGQPPVPGEDGRLESLIPSMTARSPVLDEHGLADFHELGDILTVKEGAVLIRRIPATAGLPGQTVTGKTLPAKPGKDIVFASKMDGAMIAPGDPDTLIATISGCPKILKNGVTVDPVYTVKDVDLHCGNIEYDGTVHITGDVHANMTVRSSGDIYVDGTVESAMLEAGGDIVVKGGIFGSSELNLHQSERFHPAVDCKGSCTARFAQNAHISAGQGIFIHDVALLCELTAGHQVIVGDEGSRKGEIIGGSAQAGMLIKAKHIGSSDFLRTQVIAKPSDELLARHAAAIKARETAEHRFTDLLRLLDMARQNPGRIPPASVRAAEETRDSLNTEIETLRSDEAELQKEIELSDKAQVIVEKRVYGGSEIQIGAKLFRVMEDREGGTIHLNEDGEIAFD